MPGSDEPKATGGFDWCQDCYLVWDADWVRREGLQRCPECNGRLVELLPGEHPGGGGQPRRRKPSGDRGSRD